jgi:prepilin-type N-terminal cleavage/methylation domain-containing protein
VRRAARPDGFTFIEMMIVIAILSLLASVVVVNLDNISAPTKVRGAARAVGNQVAELKQMAALHDRWMSLEFDLEAQRWRVIDAPTDRQVPDERDREELTFYSPWETLPGGVRIESVAFSDTDVERDGGLVITFGGDGEVSPSGFVVFFVHENLTEDEGMSVEVSGLTGLVHYHHGRFEAEEIRRADDF